MAEREGFEPSVPLLVVHAISSRAPSASSDISPVLYFKLRCELLANLAEWVGFEYTLPVELSLNINVLGTVVYWDLKDP